MTKLERLLYTFPRPYLTDIELDALVGGTPDSRYGKVKRLLAQGRLLRVRRGLYCLSDKTTTHPYELAQFIYGPSYISLESALGFHNLIPEAIYTVTSATTKRSKNFQTPFGLFSYLHLPQENFYLQVELIRGNGQQFLMAKPWKAICDYVYCYKKNWKSLKPLSDSLRIDIEALPYLHEEEIQLLDEYYHHSRISHFLKALQRDLKV